jgi:hypothetical protein
LPKILLQSELVFHKLLLLYFSDNVKVQFRITGILQGFGRTAAGCLSTGAQGDPDEVIIGNTCQLRQIDLARNNTDKIDADKLCQAIKAQILSGVQQMVPVTLPPVEIQELRSLFSTYRLYQKQNTQLKNRIHPLLKERLYGFTQEEIFDQKSRKEIRALGSPSILNFQINQLMDRLERDEADREVLIDHRGYNRCEPVQGLQAF